MGESFSFSFFIVIFIFISLFMLHFKDLTATVLKRVIKVQKDMTQIIQKATTVLEEPINKKHPRITVSNYNAEKH